MGGTSYSVSCLGGERNDVQEDYNLGAFAQNFRVFNDPFICQCCKWWETFTDAFRPGQGERKEGVYNVTVLNFLGRTSKNRKPEGRYLNVAQKAAECLSAPIVSSCLVCLRGKEMALPYSRLSHCWKVQPVPLVAWAVWSSGVCS